MQFDLFAHFMCSRLLKFKRQSFWINSHKKLLISKGKFNKRSGQNVAYFPLGIPPQRNTQIYKGHIAHSPKALAKIE